jgi:hypothetical protein
MPASTLDPDFTPEPDRQLGIGHGTDALGPSDLSDTGSDVQGGYRAIEELDLGLDRGTNEDSDSYNLPAGDDTSDSSKTGEDTTTGRSGDVTLDADIGIDRIESLAADEDVGADADADAVADPDADPDPDADAYVDPALTANAEADAAALDDPDASGNPIASADPDREIAALADDEDVDEDADGEVPLFDKVTRTEEQPPTGRSH